MGLEKAVSFWRSATEIVALKVENKTNDEDDWNEMNKYEHR